MLTSISWQEFLLVGSALSVLYYSLILIRYYRAEMLSIITKRSFKKPKKAELRREVLGEAKLDDEAPSLSSDEIPFHSVPKSN